MQSRNPGAFPRNDEPLQIIHISNLVLNITPLTMVEPEEAIYDISKKGKNYGKLSISHKKMVLRRVPR